MRGRRLRALITGCSGFAGGHLASELLGTSDWTVWGTTFLPGEQHHDALAGVELLQADLREPSDVQSVLAAARPDVVFHLAGQPFVPESWARPWETFETNVRMQLNVLNAVAEDHPSARVIAVTSNEVYGRVPEAAQPTGEDAPFAPQNPYATSKAAQDLLAGQYGRSPGLDIVRVRPFNHLGSGQNDRFVAASFARQVAEAELGLREPVIRVGDLAAERDFTDVRDIVRGYRLAAERAERGAIFNLGSGKAHAVRRILDFMVGASEVTVTVIDDPDRMRPSDVPRTLCDASAARDALEWEPTITFPDTLRDVLDDWRRRVRQGMGTD